MPFSINVAIYTIDKNTFLEALLVIQSNLYKMTTFGTTQKWSSWKGGCLVKNLYQATTNQIWLFLAGISFFFSGECFERSKRFAILHVLEPF